MLFWLLLLLVENDRWPLPVYTFCFCCLISDPKGRIREAAIILLFCLKSGYEPLRVKAFNCSAHIKPIELRQPKLSSAKTQCHSQLQISNSYNHKCKQISFYFNSYFSTFPLYIYIYIHMLHPNYVLLRELFSILKRYCLLNFIVDGSVERFKSPAVSHINLMILKKTVETTLRERCGLKYPTYVLFYYLG